jgi:putative DNA primase/helicase
MSDDENVVDINAAKANGATPKRARKSKLREDRQATGDWRDGICYTREGEIEGTVANAITILSNDDEWKGVLQWDEFAQVVTTFRVPPWDQVDAPVNPEAGGWGDSDTVRVQAWFARHYALNVGRECVYDAVRVVAEKTVINPPKDWLLGLRWDGVRRVPSWLTKYMGVAPSPYVMHVGIWMLVSAAARIMKPGCKVDTMTVFEGPQGLGKSTAAKELFGEQWFSDTPLDLSSKDRFVALRGHLCHEIAELDAFGKAEIARVKSFLSSQTDDFRPPYGKSNVKVPRRCIFVGTVNDSEYLKDPTGNRRLWPVRCGKIDIAALKRDRAQLLAEAREMFSSGERWWPEGHEVGLCEDAQSERAFQDAWMDHVRTFVEKERLMWGDKTFLTVGSVLAGALGITKDGWGQSEQNRVARCLLQLGWQSTRRRRRSDETGRATRVHGYVPPGTDPSRVDDEPGTQVGTGEAE